MKGSTLARRSRTHDIYPISLREIEVKRVEDLTPGMRRIVFGGEQFGEHERDGVVMPALVSDGFDDDVRIIFPDPDTGERPYPAPLGDGRLDWSGQIADLFRAYTVRSWNEDAQELVIDFARHGDGLAERWSRQAAPGNRVYIAGPKNCGVLPTHTDALIIAGDETALPAIGRALEEITDGHSTLAVIEVPDRQDIQSLSTSATIRWVVRNEGGDFVEELARSEWPEGTPYLWAAGEAGRLKGVRAIVAERGIPREHVEIHGYWRDTETTGMGPLFALHEMAELAAPLALRAAVNLNLFELIGAGERDVDKLSAAAGLDAGRLERFLILLHHLGLVKLEDRAIELTDMGAELADPTSRASATLKGPQGLAELAFLNLEEAIRSGGPVEVGTTGKTWAELETQNPHWSHAEMAGAAAQAEWTAPAYAVALARRGLLDAGVTIEGPGAEVYRDELARRNPGLSGSDQVTVLIDPFAREVDPSAMIADTASPTVVIATELLSVGGEDHDAEHDLLKLCLRGTRTPMARDVARAAVDAGYLVESSEPVGWGRHMVVLTRK